MNIQEHSRILYAENNDDDCLMLSVLLGFANIEVTCAKTVEEAWRLAQNQYFDLYLLDVQFPDGDGLELCRRLRELAPYRPILFYSGNAFETDKKKGLAAGATDYLTKPFINDLTVTILKAVKLSKKPLEQSSGNRYNQPPRCDEAQASN